MSFNTPSIELAIEPEPIMVEPQTLLNDVIALMNKRRLNLDSKSISSSCSCVLVIQNEELLGIFTERDIVRLFAKRISFEGTEISEVMTKSVITLEKSAFKDIFTVLFLFRRYRIRHLPIISKTGKIIGVVSPESIRNTFRPDNFLKIRQVADVMTKNVITASMNTSVLEIAQLMAKYRVSCIVIVQESSQKYWQDASRKPVGIITERDIVQFQALGADLLETPAKSVMSYPLFLLAPEDSLWNAHKEMLRRHVRRLVVSWNWGQGLGIVTLTSILRIFDPVEMYRVIQTLQETVETLESEKAQLLQELHFCTSNSEYKRFK
ncbi:MAG: CBS domain-containing protein [Cyanobacteria bacterium J06633_8]